MNECLLWRSRSSILDPGRPNYPYTATTCMATMAASAVFLDTNVLVYATVASAPLHLIAAEAIERLEQEGGELWISRQVIREYLAVLTRPQTFT